MSKHVSVVLDDRNLNNIAELKRVINKPGSNLNNGRSSTSSIVNFVIAEFFDIFHEALITNNANKSYNHVREEIKQELDAAGKRSLDSKVNQILQLVAENYYLTMATSQALVINPDDFKNVESMFKEGTPQHAMHTVMRNQVNDDAHRNLLLNQTKIRKGHSHEN